MRERINAIVEELKRRKAEGETHVFVQPGSIEQLRESVTRAPAEKTPVPASGEDRSPAAIPAAPDSSPPFIRPSSTKPVTEPSPTLIAPTVVSAVPPRRGRPAAASGLPEPPVVNLPEGDKRTRWEWLRERVLNCPVCQANLNPGRKIVFGDGNIDSPVFFCGEAPGADEEIQGIPFVGKAGQLLVKIIKAMGYEKQDVYIGNIMNWRPQTGSTVGNRPPTPEEMAFCLPYLRAQVDVVAPKVIVALGNTALKGLLGPNAPGITRARGRWFDFNGTPLMPTYHPSYVLRYGSPKTKREIWEDMLAVMEKIGMEISEKQRGYFLPK